MGIFSRAQQIIRAEVESLLDEAEKRTPNLEQFSEAPLIDGEVSPRSLRQGDHVILVEHHREHENIADMLGARSLEGTIFSIDKRNEIAHISTADTMETVSFSEARFFTRESMKNAGYPEKNTRRPRVRREDMEDDVIYEGVLDD